MELLESPFSQILRGDTSLFRQLAGPRCGIQLFSIAPHQQTFSPAYYFRGLPAGTKFFPYPVRVTLCPRPCVSALHLEPTYSFPLFLIEGNSSRSPPPRSNSQRADGAFSQ